MRARQCGFSLIELLVALAILGVVAAIIVPSFLGIQNQAQQAVVDANAKEISNATNRWLALGGHTAANAATDPYAAFRMLQFISTTSNGSDPQRYLGESGPGIIDPNYPVDTLGVGGSWTESLPITVGVAANPVHGNPGTPLSSASQANGFYTEQEVGAGAQASQPGIVTDNGATVSTNSYLYEKQGSFVYPVDYDLATAVFIRTGTAVGEPAVTPGTLP